MPIKKSAKKHLRTSSRKKGFNSIRKETIKKVIKKTAAAISGNKKEEAAELFRKAQKAFDKAVKTGIIKKNTASRRKSRLIKKIKMIK